MKRAILIIIDILLIIFILRLSFNMILNNYVVDKYGSGNYGEIVETVAAVTLNYSQQIYVPLYNYGNIYYQNGDYIGAISLYMNALTHNISKKRDSKIRINYALALCKLVELDESDQQSIRDAIKIYETAIGVLTEKGAAHMDDDNGYSPDAQQLKNDIQKEIDRLEDLLENSSKNGNDENGDEDENNSGDNVDTIEKKVTEIKEDATKEQREKEDVYKKDKKISNVEKNW